MDDVIVRLALKMKHEEHLRIVDAGSQAVADLLPYYLGLNQLPHAYTRRSTTVNELNSTCENK